MESPPRRLQRARPGRAPVAVRLLFVHNLPFWDPRAGGGQRINHELARQAALRGHDVTVLHLVKSAAASAGAAPSLPYRVVEVPEAPRLLINALRVARRVGSLARSGVDVVYGSAAEGGLIPDVLPVGVGLLATTQHPDPARIPAVDWGRPLRTLRELRLHQQPLLEANLLRHAHVVTVPSDWSRRTIRERGWLPPDQPVSILPNGVGELWFEPPRVPSSGRFDVLLVGRMDAQKGVDVLLRALARPELRRVRARIVGTGGASEELRAMASRLGLAGRVEFVGHRSHEEVRTDMTGARLFALPSRAESFGMAIVEAMAAGLPVVTTAAGGIVEFARHGENALVVPVDDDAALGTAIRRVLDDDALARTLGEGGRRTAERYRWTTIGERLDEQLRLARELARPAGRPRARRLGQAYRGATAAWSAARAPRGVRHRPPPERADRIAISRFGLMGDLLLTDPLLAALEERFPGAELELIVSDPKVVPPWMTASGRVTVTHLRARSDADRWARPGHQELRADLEALGERWQAAPPDVLLLGDPIESAVMTYLAAELSKRAPRAWRAALVEGTGEPRFVDRVVRVPGDAHEITRLLALAGAVGASSDFRLPRVPHPATGRSLPGHLAVHAGASRPQKLWPLDSFARLIEQVHQRTGARIVLVGTSGEGQIAERISPRVPVLDLTGATSVAQLAEVLGSVSAFVGNDSFPFHLAVAAGTPAVVLAGPSAARWIGYPHPHATVVREPVVCSPRRGEECPVYAACPHAACMTGIPVDRALDAVIAALEAGRAERLG
jgi:glycosyltransferase involved in cell wall biosynthesis/ADP-heptose:LPS heptosyltransferase